MPSSCMRRPLLPTGRMPSLSSTGPLPSGEALIVNSQAQGVSSRESIPPKNSPQLPGMSSVAWSTPAGQCRRTASSRARAWARMRTAPILSMPCPRIRPRTLVARVCEESSQRPVPRCSRSVSKGENPPDREACPCPPQARETVSLSSSVRTAVTVRSSGQTRRSRASRVANPVASSWTKPW